MTLELRRLVCFPQAHAQDVETGKLVSHLKRMFEKCLRWDKLVFTTSDAETTLEMRKFAYSPQAPIRNLTHVLGWLSDSGDVRLIQCCACQCKSEQRAILACSNEVSFSLSSVPRNFQTQSRHSWKQPSCSSGLCIRIETTRGYRKASESGVY